MNNEETKELTENIFRDTQTLDEQKKRLIIRKIIELENENVKTRDLNDDEMKKKIIKIIEEEVKCC